MEVDWRKVGAFVFIGAFVLLWLLSIEGKGACVEWDYGTAAPSCVTYESDLR